MDRRLLEDATGWGQGCLCGPQGVLFGSCIGELSLVGVVAEGQSVHEALDAW